MFCFQCGTELPNDAVFCSNCGTAVRSTPVEPKETIQASKNVQPGFSNRIHDSSLQAAVKKGNKGTLIFAVILVLLPIVVTFFIGASQGDFSVMPIGLLVAGIMLVFNLVSLLKKKGAKQWDGVVIDKTSRERLNRDIEDKGRKSYTEYTVLLRDDAGKTRKIVEGTPNNSAHPYFEYLNIGDKVRFHPQFHNFYEKYDKTHDSYVYCAICGKPNDLSGEHCQFCNALLIK